MVKHIIKLPFFKKHIIKLLMFQCSLFLPNIIHKTNKESGLKNLNMLYLYDST